MARLSNPHRAYFGDANKWITGGGSSALFIETPNGTWKALVDDDGSWSVRGPDPDNPLHLAGGEVSNADADVKTGNAAGRVSAAKKRARAYIKAQIG